MLKKDINLKLFNSFKVLVQPYAIREYNKIN